MVWKNERSRAVRGKEMCIRDSKCGVHGFEKLLTLHGKLPDAIICANDNIAVGVCETAEAHGYKAPDDFLVTGFDNFDKASYCLLYTSRCV